MSTGPAAVLMLLGCLLFPSFSWADDGDRRAGSSVDCDAKGRDKAEVPYNGLDDDCDPGTPDDDLDGDGLFRLEDCDDQTAGDSRVVSTSVSWPSKDSPCKGIQGLVLRGSLLVGKGATDLTGLSCLCAVTGNVEIQGSDRLRTLQGLEHLQVVGGDVAITGNPALEGLDGLGTLTTVGGDFQVSDNDALAAIDGLDQLQVVGGDFQVSENQVLTAVEGVNTLRTIGGELGLTDNPSLATVDGLVAVSAIGASVALEGNPVLDEAGTLLRFQSQTQPPPPPPRSGVLRSILLALGVAMVGGVLVLVASKAYAFFFPTEEEGVAEDTVGPDLFAHLRFDGQKAPPGADLPLALAGLTPEEVASAKPHLQLVNAAYGDVLIRQDDADAAVAWVIEGELSVSVDGNLVGRVLPEELVGEMSLFEDAYRGADVSAVAPTRMLVIERAAYKALTAMNHPVARTLEQVAVKCMGRKLRDSAKRLGGDVALSNRARQRPLDRDAVMERLVAFGKALSPVEGGLRPPSPAAVLAASPVFGHVPREILARVGAQARFREYAAGQPILVQGDPGADMFVLASGRVDMVIASPTRDDLVLVDDLHPGDMFGLAALFHEEAHVASAVALGPVSTAVLDARTVKVLLASDEPEGRYFRIAAVLALAASLREVNASLSGQPSGGDQAANLHDVRSIVAPGGDPSGGASQG